MDKILHDYPESNKLVKRRPEEPMNSGALLHTASYDRIWPKNIGAQLMHAYGIVCDGSNVMLFVNGFLQNEDSYSSHFSRMSLNSLPVTLTPSPAT